MSEELSEFLSFPKAAPIKAQQAAVGAPIKKARGDKNPINVSECLKRAEADRIAVKHLLILEPGISQTQTDEMRKERLQLVLLRSIHESYRPAQEAEVTSVAEFLDLATRASLDACGQNGALPGLLL